MRYINIHLHLHAACRVSDTNKSYVLSRHGQQQQQQQQQLIPGHRETREFARIGALFA